MIEDVVVAFGRFVNLLAWLIVIRALLSWFIKDPRNPIVIVIHGLTEPLLGPVRKLLFKLNLGGNTLDFSPLLVILILQILNNVIIRVFM